MRTHTQHVHICIHTFMLAHKHTVYKKTETRGGLEHEDEEA